MKFKEKVRFSAVTNKSEENIVLCPNWPTNSKGKPITNSLKIILSPNKTSRPLPYVFLIGSKDWGEMVTEDKISLNDLYVKPPFVIVKNISPKEVTFKLKLLENPKKKNSKTKEPQEIRKKIDVKIPPGQKFTPIHLNSIIDITDIEFQNSIIVEPVLYIGPPMIKPPCIGSLGYEDVYGCSECGGPIVFRYHPARPIHI